MTALSFVKVATPLSWAFNPKADHSKFLKFHVNSNKYKHNTQQTNYQRHYHHHRLSIKLYFSFYVN